MLNNLRHQSYPNRIHLLLDIHSFLWLKAENKSYFNLKLASSCLKDLILQVEQETIEDTAIYIQICLDHILSQIYLYII